MKSAKITSFCPLLSKSVIIGAVETWLLVNYGNVDWFKFMLSVYTDEFV